MNKSTTHTDTQKDYSGSATIKPTSTVKGKRAFTDLALQDTNVLEKLSVCHSPTLAIWQIMRLYIQREFALERTPRDQLIVSEFVWQKSRNFPPVLTALTAIWHSLWTRDKTSSILLSKTLTSAAVLSKWLTCLITCATYSTNGHNKFVIQPLI